ncbi:MAG: hypothetical protein CL927_18570 [Deltaproteobacteria bacterium]|nr:hypothetical protein [Deltaproteobacteria bacterium]HCH62578.1 hypothetical protein [Deltaproteobacteria bacterium]
MRWTRAACLCVICSLFVSAPAAWAQDDLDKMLNAIPDVPNAEKSEEEADAAPEVTEEAVLPAYVKAVRQAVLEQWEPKAKIIKKNPKAKAQFLVKIDINGKRTGLAAVELSQVKAFDKSVLDAIVVTTFPPPPPQILSDVERGVVVTISARSYNP